VNVDIRSEWALGSLRYMQCRIRTPLSTLANACSGASQMQTASKHMRRDGAVCVCVCVCVCGKWTNTIDFMTMIVDFESAFFCVQKWRCGEAEAVYILQMSLVFSLSVIPLNAFSPVTFVWSFSFWKLLQIKRNAWI
jgi:hypothetical protein